MELVLITYQLYTHLGYCCCAPRQTVELVCLFISLLEIIFMMLHLFIFKYNNSFIMKSR
jgi:hypothetical protein